MLRAVGTVCISCNSSRGVPKPRHHDCPPLAPRERSTVFGSRFAARSRSLAYPQLRIQILFLNLLPQVRLKGIEMKSGKSIPAPDEELKAQCNAENQFDNFQRVFRKVMSVPKAEILKREAKEKHRNARKRARNKKD